LHKLKIKSQPIIFCAQQRSGTTVLQAAFHASHKCKNYGEVFHDEYQNFNKEFSFFKVREQMIKESPNLCVPFTNNQKFVFDGFFDLLQKSSQAPFHVIDVKYNSWHHFNTTWHSPMEPPTMLQFIMGNKIPIIHIKRRNLLHQYLSLKVAISSGKFHYNKNERGKQRKKIRIQPNHCKMSMRIVRKDVNNFQYWLANYPFYYEVVYEEMIIANKFSNQLNSIVSEITNGEITRLGDPPLKKGISDPFALIENKDELINALKNSNFREFV